MDNMNLCGCGCGQYTKYTFLRGHQSRLRSRDEHGNKQCPECKEWKPATIEYFGACKNRKDGITAHCRPCHHRIGTRNRQSIMASNPNAAERIRKRWRENRKQRTKENPSYMRDIKHRSAQRLRKQVIDAYGGKCACCGETSLPFLTLDHVNGDGKAHREQLKTGGGYMVYIDLRKRGFPQDGFRILCWNCHMATAHGRPCPHTNVPTLSTTINMK